MPVPYGLLTIEKSLDDDKGNYTFSLEHSTLPVPLVCTITSPSSGAALTPGTPVTITGTITYPGTVVVKLGSTTLGNATVANLTWSYSWTPQVGDGGAQTINAAAAAAVGGGTANATGVGVFVAVSLSALLPGAYQVVQTDLGLTYGGTTLAAGTTPPVGSLSGTIAGKPVPIWFKCTTAGVIGAGAVFAAYYDGAGVTPAMTGITPSAGVPVALTGAGNGMSHAWAAGTASLNNIWKATCSGILDQSGNGKHYSQPVASKQLVVTAGLNGKPGLLFDGVDDTLNSTFSAGFPYKLWAVFRATVGGPGAYFGEGGMLFCLTGDPSAGVSQYANAFANSTPMGINVWTRVESIYTNTTGDSLKVGSAAPTTGQNAGPAPKTTSAIGSNSGSQFASMELLALAWLPGGTSTAAADAAINSVAGYGPGSIAA